MRKTWPKAAGFERGPGAKQCRWFLEAAKGKGMDSPSYPPERSISTNILMLAYSDPLYTFSLQN